LRFGPDSRRRDWNNAVRVTIDNQGGYFDARHIGTEVLMPGWNTCQAGGRRCASSDVPTSAQNLLADTFTEEQIGVVEILEELGEKRVAVCSHRFLNALEDTGVNALGVIRGLSKNGGTPPTITALLTPLEPYFPK
jgi:hypothetical protein